MAQIDFYQVDYLWEDANNVRASETVRTKVALLSAVSATELAATDAVTVTTLTWQTQSLGTLEGDIATIIASEGLESPADTTGLTVRVVGVQYLGKGYSKDLLSIG